MSREKFLSGRKCIALMVAAHRVLHHNSLQGAREDDLDGDIAFKSVGIIKRERCS